MKNFHFKNLLYDIPSGIIVALVSIPISMGYAQVAGLPPQYGLYGSLLPILIFGLMTTSPRYVLGVDAAPCALVGGLIASLGITQGTDNAMQTVQIITIMVALWLFLFTFLHAGRFVKFISTPVMGGFISGIGCTIILMQVPKLFGGGSGEGELPALMVYIIAEAILHFNLPSLLLGLLTIFVIRTFKKRFPRIPMAVVMMLGGALITYFFHIEQYGIVLLPAVSPGLPMPLVPHLHILLDNIKSITVTSLTVAIVITAESLLSTNNFGLKHDDSIDNQRELLSYAAANTVAAAFGSAPVSGSVSRTGIADQFGVKSQAMSVTASITMGLILLYGTDFIAYLPVPVLTGIVIAALIGVLEFDLAKNLHKADKTEWMIFYVVFFVVLFMGTIYGVAVGILLSFITVTIRASAPPRGFLGCLKDYEGFYSLQRMPQARPIENAAIYRFSGSLFFADIGLFEEDVKKASHIPGISTIIIDASGIGSIDVTACERLLLLYRNLKKKEIRFYITEHDAHVTDQLKTFGAEALIREGAVKAHIELALKDAGIEPPYTLHEEKAEVTA